MVSSVGETFLLRLISTPLDGIIAQVVFGCIHFLIRLIWLYQKYPLFRLEAPNPQKKNHFVFVNLLCYPTLCLLRPTTLGTGKQTWKTVLGRLLPPQFWLFAFCFRNHRIENNTFTRYSSHFWGEIYSVDIFINRLARLKPYHVLELRSFDWRIST